MTGFPVDELYYARYIKLDNISAVYAVIHEISIKTKLGIELAKQPNAVCYASSSVDTSRNQSKANDNSLDTWWHMYGAPGWFLIDLLSTKGFSSIEYYPLFTQSSNYAMRSFVVKLSDDNINYRTIKTCNISGNSVGYYPILP